MVTHAYRDVAGIWTVGVGHTAAAGPPSPVRGLAITRDEAFAVLARDLPKYERRVAAALGASPVDQTMFDGAVSFDFNTGAIDRASWVAALLNGCRALARTRLMQWTKAGGRTVAGVVRRREAEARLIFDGDYGRPHSVASPVEIRRTQMDLVALGFYRGPVDGIAGAATKAAVLAYQRGHPDLVADGVAGPATQASIARDVALRQSVGAVVGAAAGAATVSAAAAVGTGGSPLVVAAIAGVAVLVAFGIFLALRYRDELTRAFRPTQGS